MKNYHFPENLVKTMSTNKTIIARQNAVFIKSITESIFSHKSSLLFAMASFLDKKALTNTLRSNLK